MLLKNINKKFNFTYVVSIFATHELIKQTEQTTIKILQTFV